MQLTTCRAHSEGNHQLVDEPIFVSARISATGETMSGARPRTELLVASLVGVINCKRHK